MLYSRVPLSSAWPWIGKVKLAYCCSHCACLSSVPRDCDVSSVESDSKKTRSPTFTTKSCWLPGAAEPAEAKESLACLLAQADRASPAIKAATTPAVRNLRKTLLMYVPPIRA